VEETADSITTTDTTAQQQSKAAENAVNTPEQDIADINTDNLINQNKSLAEENASLKEELAFLKLKIKDEFKEDAMILAKPLINDDCNLHQALTTVIERYPQFIEQPKMVLNLGGPTQGIGRTTPNAFVSGLKNSFWGGK
jgi:hypothetical protein